MYTLSPNRVPGSCCKEVNTLIPQDYTSRLCKKGPTLISLNCVPELWTWLGVRPIIKQKQSRLKGLKRAGSNRALLTRDSYEPPSYRHSDANISVVLVLEAVNM